MVAPVHNFDPKTLLEGSAKLRWVGRGAGGLLFQSLCGPVERKALDVGGLSSSLKKSIYFLESPSPWRPSLIDFIYFWGSNKKQRSCDGRVGRAAPVWRGNEFQKTGARSARARTRGQNPLVFIYLFITSLSATTPILPKTVAELALRVINEFYI
jgi:hypothetical protein